MIGSRPYEPGDPVSTIDWFASARLSSASGGDEFVVRDRAADEAPRVTIVLDRRPAMALYPPPLPWLSKREALREAAICDRRERARSRAPTSRRSTTATASRGGYRRDAATGRGSSPTRAAEAPFDAPDDNVAATRWRFSHSAARTFPAAPSSSSSPTSSSACRREAWLDAVAHGWDVVPVVVQDPVWERSWPDVAGIGLPVVHAGLVRLGRRKAARLRAEHEARYAGLLAELQSVGLRPVELDSSDPYSVDEAFLAWAEERRRGRWAR